MIRPKALLEDRQSPAVQRRRLGVSIGLGQQSGGLAEAQPGRASRRRVNYAAAVVLLPGAVNKDGGNYAIAVVRQRHVLADTYRS